MSGGDKLDFEIRPNPAPVAAAERAALLANPGFGRIFTDHMVTIRYADGKGWYDARVEARAPIPMDPATAVLHYAQEIFEGLKAYRCADGGVAMFRPDANAAPVRVVRPADGDAARCRSELFLELAAPAHRDRPGLDPDRPRRAASTCARSCTPARSSSACARPREYLYVVIASPVGAVLRRRRQAGDRVGLAGLHPGGARRHRRGQVRRQLRRSAGRPGRGDRARLRPGRLPRRGGAHATSTSSAA